MKNIKLLSILSFIFTTQLSIAGGVAAPVNATELTQITNGAQAKQYMMQQITQLAEGLVKSQTGIDVSKDNREKLQKTFDEVTGKQTDELKTNDDKNAKDEKINNDKNTAELKTAEKTANNFIADTTSAYNPNAVVQVSQQDGGEKFNTPKTIKAANIPTKSNYKFDELQRCKADGSGWGSDASSASAVSATEVKYGCSNGQVGKKLSINAAAQKVKEVCLAKANIDEGMLAASKIHEDKMEEFKTRFDEETKKPYTNEADAKASQTNKEDIKFNANHELGRFARLKDAAQACQQTLSTKRDQYSHESVYGSAQSGVGLFASTGAALVSKFITPMGRTLDRRGDYASDKNSFKSPAWNPK